MSSIETSRSRGAATTAALEVHLLGLVDFDAALALQERLVFDISGRDDTQGTLLLCEHPPLITMGREASAAHIQADAHDLRACEIEVRWIGRGGGACVHAPGQLAVYPLLPLDRLGLGVDAFRSRLEESLLAACRDVRVPARRRADEPGLWSRSGQIAQFGAALKSWVSYHGMFLNVAPDPGFLRLVHVNPLGERATSLQAQVLRRISMSKVREAVVRHVAARFGYQRQHVYAGHPLLQRTRRRVCLHV